MFFKLFQKECMQTGKSLIYWIYVVCIGLFFFTQMGSPSFDKIQPPIEGQEETYGDVVSKDEKEIMRAVLGNLLQEWEQDSWTVYPIGFVKHVKLSQEEKGEIQEILSRALGKSREEMDREIEEYYGEKPVIMMGAYKTEPASSYTYQEFQKDMKRVCRILGPGSDYEEKSYSQGTEIPATYEQSLKEYENYLEEDKISGGYARLFSDYLGIALGILPVFPAVTRFMRDKRAKMKELVYTRAASSGTIVAGRYLAMVFMLLLPVLACSFYTLIQCAGYTSSMAIEMDYLAFLPYVFGWLFPEILAVCALGMFFTELTDTAVAALIQGIWWFVEIFTGVDEGLANGSYGFHLVMRHNSALGYEVFWENFRQLMLNRGFYTALALLFVLLTIWIYGEKRKGRLDLYAKIHVHRKNRAKI